MSQRRRKKGGAGSHSLPYRSYHWLSSCSIISQRVRRAMRRTVVTSGRPPQHRRPQGGRLAGSCSALNRTSRPTGIRVGQGPLMSTDETLHGQDEEVRLGSPVA
ncbi:uncharacterized protein N7482_009170 [Penicillium canariense]|uniref:Uncharacterized protein n=1 Tax=Penicillium canariense TaxID=189055 RepID=A0A9W9LFT4_9EURO|nr:uncharacterized protein N7482_009170 [Penicillium canariense]KAJ5152692.1 hypothetical protein N7482_009170 [Penicillium canariense]